MTDLLSNFGQLLSQNIWLAFVMALVVGLVPSFSPCVISAVPLIIGYVGGYAGNDRKKAFKYSLFFCIGLAATFTALGAFLFGIVGGILSSPCATPVLAAILAFVAGQDNIVLGVALLAVYAVGHCALILVASTSVGFVQALAASPGTEKLGRLLKLLFGILVLLLAFYLFWIGFG